MGSRMAGDEDWEPWIQHDGAYPPPELEARFQRGARIQVVEEIRDLSLITLERDARGNLLLWPGFYWRWQNVKIGWFRTEKRRVCDDPAYAPIIRYRFRKPPRAAASTEVGVEILRRIAADPKQPVVAPAPEKERA